MNSFKLVLKKNKEIIYEAQAKNFSQFLELAVRNNISLAGVDLSEQTIENVRFDRVNFSRVHFDKTTFRKCNMSGSHFVNVELNNTVFDNCVLSEAEFPVRVSHCKFLNCDMLNTDLSFGTFKNVSFIKCLLKKNKIEESFFDNCDFSDSTLQILQKEGSAVFINCKLQTMTMEPRSYQNIWLLEEMVKRTNNKDIYVKLLSERNLKYQAVACQYYGVEKTVEFIASKLDASKEEVRRLLDETIAGVLSVQNCFKLLSSIELACWVKEWCNHSHDIITLSKKHYADKFFYLFYEYINDVYKSNKPTHSLAIYFSYFEESYIEDTLKKLNTRANYKSFSDVFDKFCKINACKTAVEMQELANFITTVPTFERQHSHLYKVLGYEMYTDKPIDYILAQKKYMTKINGHTICDEYHIRAVNDYRQAVNWEVELNTLTNYLFMKESEDSEKKYVIYGIFNSADKLEAVFLVQRRTLVACIGENGKRPNEKMIGEFISFAALNNDQAEHIVA